MDVIHIFTSRDDVTLHEIRHRKPENPFPKSFISRALFGLIMVLLSRQKCWSKYHYFLYNEISLFSCVSTPLYSLYYHQMKGYLNIPNRLLKSGIITQLTKPELGWELCA